MRLRELNFPIAIRTPWYFVGGRFGGLSNKRTFNFNLESAFLEKDHSKVEIFDSTGQQYLVKAIEFRKPSFWYSFGHRAGNFFLPDPDSESMVHVDMKLVGIRSFELEPLKQEFLGSILNNPSWWERHLSESELKENFRRCTKIPAVIDAVGYLEPPRQGSFGRNTVEIIDLR